MTITLRAGERITYVLMILFLPVLAGMVIESLGSLGAGQAALLVGGSVVAGAAVIWKALSTPRSIRLTESHLEFQSPLRTQRLPIAELTEVRHPRFDLAGAAILWVGTGRKIQTSSGYVPLHTLLMRLRDLRPDLDIAV